MAIEIVSNIYDNEIRYQFPNAYLKVHDVEIRISTNEAWIRVLVFANKESRDTEGACSVKKITEKVSLNALTITSFDKAGLITAAYNYLKTIEKYNGLSV
ncbi:MAG: hypothetical protein CVT92_02460 [Bacteroidetes bacterium HGW-Bacteroidetes-1]|jgi:hypothetical protein|nr:MAG: hypothetical protein CVT92_02460 [Bacteroidetes bacterium HGW-Bacteroidetes-1]